MIKPNPFQQAAEDISAMHNRSRDPAPRFVTSRDGIDAQPLSFFSESFRLLLLKLLGDGQADFVVCEDKLYILRSTVEPYLPGGIDWDDLS
jgi:hypothetical protein